MTSQSFVEVNSGTLDRFGTQEYNRRANFLDQFGRTRSLTPRITAHYGVSFPAIKSFDGATKNTTSRSRAFIRPTERPIARRLGTKWRYWFQKRGHRIERPPHFIVSARHNVNGHCRNFMNSQFSVSRTGDCLPYSSKPAVHPFKPALRDRAPLQSPAPGVNLGITTGIRIKVS